MSCSYVEYANKMEYASYNKTGLLYDEMNKEIFNINSEDAMDYDVFESKACISIISEDEKCKKCKNNYSFITCSNCCKETCAKKHCCTLYHDYYGYMSICKDCEYNILRKLKPYIEDEDNDVYSEINIIKSIIEKLKS